MSFTSSNGTALITGASAGIGAVYADRLARRGYDLVLVARERARLEAVAAGLRAETGVSIDVVSADLGAEDDLARVAQRLAGDETLTLLVNNAGMGVAGHVIDTDIERLEAMIRLNIAAVTRLVRAAIPGFVARGRGTIINVGSVLALAPEQFNACYAGTKAYVLAFSQALHHELGRKGVRVQAVLPGATRTQLWERSGLDITRLPASILMEAEEMVDAALAGLDQGELVTIPSLPEVADWDAFLAARARLGPNLSRDHAAARYKVGGTKTDPAG